MYREIKELHAWQVSAFRETARHWLDANRSWERMLLGLDSPSYALINTFPNFLAGYARSRKRRHTSVVALTIGNAEQINSEVKSNFISCH